MGHVPFRGAVPDDRLYDAGHDMWVREKAAGVEVGATAFGVFLAGTIIGFTAKPRGAEIARGRGLGTVECAKTVLAVRSPLSGVLLEGNEDAEERPARINDDPYRDGWMARLRPTAWEAERGQLVDAAAYRAHVARVEPGAELT